VQIELTKIKDTVIERSFCLERIKIVNSHKEQINLNSISGDYQVYRIDENDIHVKVNFCANLTTPCSKCTEIFTMDIKDNFSVIYTNQIDYTEGEVTLKDADLDIKFFEGEILDLEEEITNNFLLALPISPICNENCKGLCPTCGVNLNNSKCSCSDNKSDPRWKALESFINKE